MMSFPRSIVLSKLLFFLYVLKTILFYCFFLIILACVTVFLNYCNYFSKGWKDLAEAWIQRPVALEH